MPEAITCVRFPLRWPNDPADAVRTRREATMSMERSNGVPGASLLIETLLPGAEPTVLTDHGAPRAWAPLPRIGGTRATADRVRAIVAAVYDSGRPLNVVVGPRDKHRFRVSATPVLGSSGAVHAVQLWTGKPDAAPQGPPNVAAIEWSATSRLIELNAEVRDPAEDYPFAGRMSLTAPEAFSHVVRFDAAMSLIAKVLESVPEDRWEGTATVYGPRTLRTVHLAMRSMPAPRQQAWRGLIHDVTDAVPPAAPTLDSVALAAMTAGRAPTAVALMDVSQARLISWFTDPVPGIQWKGTHDERDTPHPDDVVRIFQTMERLKAGGGKHAEIPGVRLRRLGGGWTVIDSRITVIPTTGPMMVLAEMTPVEGASSEER